MGGNYQRADFKTQPGIVSTAFGTGAVPQYLTGTTVKMADVETGTLSAYVTGKAETNGLTIYHQWEVSRDGTTFRPCVPDNNAATVVLATGTSGTDAAFTSRVIAANPAVYGYPFARLRLVDGVTPADGTNDVGSIEYEYREPIVW